MSGQFTKCLKWTWKHSFTGEMSIYTDLNATEQQVKSWIGQSTQRGGSGNYDSSSLRSETTKVKTRRLELTKL